MANTKPSKKLLKSLEELRAQGIPFEKVTDLLPWDGNPNQHEAGVPKLLASLQQFGWTIPILIRASNKELSAGHGRLLAAAGELGLTEVPVIRRDFTAHESHAYALADNKIPNFSRDNDAYLESAVRELDDEGLRNLVLAAGYDETEISRILEGCAPPDDDESDGDSVDAADVSVVVGRYRFVAPRAQWNQWEDAIRTKVGFDETQLVAEIRRRLGL